MRSGSYLVPAIVIALAAAAVLYFLPSTPSLTEDGTDGSVAEGDAKPKSRDFPTPSKTGPHPKLVVDTPIYDFGSMVVGTSQSRDWVIRNEGEAPLEIMKDKTTCQCTVADLKDGEVAPGESVTITLTWTPEHPTESFNKGGIFRTNDPENTELRIGVDGTVHRALESEPPGSWDVGSFDPLEGAEFTGVVYSKAMEFDIDEVQTKSSPLLSATWEPLSEGELDDRNAKSGYNVTIRFNAVNVEETASLQQGFFQEDLSLAVNSPEEKPRSVSLTISGTRKSPLSFRPLPGASWNGRDRILNLRVIPEGEAKSSRVLLSVVDAPENFAVEPVECDDPMLDAEIKLRTESGGNKTYVLTVSVKKERSQKQRGLTNPALITIKTNHPHPTAREVQLKVTYVAL